MPIENLKQYYQNEIYPHFIASDRERVIHSKKVLLIWGAASILTAILLFIFWIPLKLYGHGDWFRYMFHVATISSVFIFTFWLQVTMVKNFKNKLRDEIISQGLNSIDKHVTYQPENLIPRSEVAHSDMYKSYYEDHIGDSYIKGQFYDIQMELSILHLCTTTANSSLMTYFRGLFFVIDLISDYKGYDFSLVPDDESLHYSEAEGLAKDYKIIFSHSTDVNDEDFKCMNSDVRKLLSPNLISLLLDVKRIFDRNISLAIRDKKLYIGFDGGKMKLINIKLFKSIKYYKDPMLILKYLEAASDIAKEVNLNIQRSSSLG